jgi:hypothetical protein
VPALKERREKREESREKRDLVPNEVRNLIASARDPSLRPG